MVLDDMLSANAKGAVHTRRVSKRWNERGAPERNVAAWLSLLMRWTATAGRSYSKRSPRPDGHAFTAEDWTALMDFAGKHLRGRKVERSFDRFPSEAELDVAAAAARR